MKWKTEICIWIIREKRDKQEKESYRISQASLFNDKWIETHRHIGEIKYKTLLVQIKNKQTNKQKSINNHEIS